MKREGPGFWQRVKDHINQVPGDRIEVGKIPEKDLREYFDRVTANAVGEGGLIRIASNLSGERDAYDLSTYASPDENEYDPEEYAALFPPNPLHLQMKTFLMRHPGKWRIYEKNKEGKSEYKFSLEYSKEQDAVIESSEETLEDRKKFQDLMDSTY